MFKTEHDLVNCITSWVDSDRNFIDGNYQSVLTEVDLGYGIADVVAVGHDKFDLKNRKNYLEYFDISILSLIEKNGRISLEEITYITRSPKSKLTRSLTSLIGEEYVSYRKGYYCSHQKYAESLTDCIAIEAKLKNWKRALKQAYRYKWFAEKSYVFLPSENLAPASKNIDMFKEYNVGLAGMSSEHGIEIIYDPHEEKPISNKMRMTLNERLLFQNRT